MNQKNPSRQSLATGFRNVDTSGDTGACCRCLDLIAGIPFFHEVKRDSIRIIADALPARVLDAGCGSGVDLPALASALPTSCSITGLDASGSLLASADKRCRDAGSHCVLVRGDILHTPFRDGTFGACRIDRVLQHIHEPAAAIGELARVLSPGGILVAFDNDWETLTLDLEDRRVVERIRASWRDSFASGRVGKDLPRIFRECGLVDIRIGQRQMVLTDPVLAEQVFDLTHLFGRMEREGTLSAYEIARIRRDMDGRARTGTFTSGYTGFLVTGTIPG